MEHGVDLSRQAVSQHLAVLEEAGLVTTQLEGKHRFVTLRTEPLVGLTDRWLYGRAASNPAEAGPERSTTTERSATGEEPAPGSDDP